jgi:hypothetical protein
VLEACRECASIFVRLFVPIGDYSSRVFSLDIEEKNGGGEILLDGSRGL